MKGTPTPLIHTLLCAPESRMGPLDGTELNQVIARSPLVEKYNHAIDRESAYELLSDKMKKAAKIKSEKQSRGPAERSTFKSIASRTITRQVGRTVARELTRGLLGVLGLGGRSRSRSSSWF